VQSIPDRIAALANRCYLKVIGCAQMITKKVAFTLDLKSRVDLQLNQRIIAINGGIASLDNSSKMVMRNCGVVVSPDTANAIPMFDLKTNSSLEMSRVNDIGTNNAPIILAKSSSVKISNMKTLSSHSKNLTHDSITALNFSKIDINAVEEFEVENGTGINSKTSTIQLRNIGKLTYTEGDTFFIKADGSKLTIEDVRTAGIAKPGY
jgi:hypothetical protein